ncbi:hypothetical protein [Pseudoalteromonas sp. T1lg75]|uniref:hypothetical protein n=1 Tax=Pseudoalteromonas sp. T1lg75 TaxID=2077102 RepID=UPI000CF6547C|nr:hypothetical protein [Pseudoalteromonas sp. T1lg75]
MNGKFQKLVSWINKDKHQKNKMDWVIDYLQRKYPMPSLVHQDKGLAIKALYQNACHFNTESEIYKNMLDAWRAHCYRANKKSKTNRLEITISDEVRKRLIKLASEVEGKSINETLALLIDNNYHAYIENRRNVKAAKTKSLETKPKDRDLYLKQTIFKLEKDISKQYEILEKLSQKLLDTN